MKTILIISLALGFLCYSSVTVTKTAAQEGQGQCITTDDCLKGVPEDGQPAYPGTCCEFYEDEEIVTSGQCIPKEKAKKCQP